MSKMENLSEPAADLVDGGTRRSVVVELPLGDASATFNLEKAVCSHGLFMMAPNHWDPLSKTLQRPLRLAGNADSDEFLSVFVRIAHAAHTHQCLHLRVFGTDFLSPRHRQSLLAQVKRMLRLSEWEERSVREFQEIHSKAKERGFGRLFRSPTLFEDMVKCILLCNCQWSRTLSMATALCELQLEIQSHCSDAIIAGAKTGSISRSLTAETEHFIPKTPAGKESKKKVRKRKSSTNLMSKFVRIQAEVNGDGAKMSNCGQRIEDSVLSLLSSNEDHLYKKGDTYQISVENLSNSDFLPHIQPLEAQDSGTELKTSDRIGNFPSARELASLDEKYLAKRCNLGYRASWILNLACSVVEGRVELRQLEEACNGPSLSNYNKLAEQLNKIRGFGPFTCSNVLMCMGFYHVIPTDSETIRHLKMVHAKNSTIRTVQKDVEMIYGKYAPYQFLAYWSEVWQFYEEWFGKASGMPHSSYKLITAANMRVKRDGNKRIKTS